MRLQSTPHNIFWIISEGPDDSEKLRVMLQKPEVIVRVDQHSLANTTIVLIQGQWIGIDWGTAYEHGLNQK